MLSGLQQTRGRLVCARRGHVCLVVFRRSNSFLLLRLVLVWVTLYLHLYPLSRACRLGVAPVGWASFLSSLSSPACSARSARLLGLLSRLLG